jgi:hypothetical protein
MPCRKSTNGRSNFAFVTLGLELKNANWLKVHSGAVRAHAAYWGGSAKSQRGGARHIISHNPNEDSNLVRYDTEKSVDDCTDTAIRQRGSPPLSFPLYYIQSDRLQNLPTVPPEIRAAGFALGAYLATFKFCGDGFVKNFFTLGHENYSVMFGGYVLLSYAHSMVLTGQGSKAILLRLKGLVIHHISERIKSTSGLLSPWCLTAVLALASPIVCLISQDLPQNMTVREYFDASVEDNFQCCCPESAEITHHALEERAVHQQAMRKIFCRSHAYFQDAVNLAFLRYISNSAEVYVSLRLLPFRLSSNSNDRSAAIDSAHHFNTPFADVGKLFPATDSCGNCSIPAYWCSPLTCQWPDEPFETPPERQTLLLTGLTHGWLATFLDKDGEEIVITEALRENRAVLRQRIERFMPAEKGLSSETDSMYEACRWASLMLLAVEKHKIPMYLVAKVVRIRPRLVKRLRMTNLTDLWGTRRGLLFWVVTTCHFATAGECFPFLCSALLARCTQEMAMLGCCSEISVKPLRRLKLFESLCCRQDGLP